MEKGNKEKILDLVDIETREAYERGKRAGLQVAQRIAAWWINNPQLNLPHSHEQLMKWTHEALHNL